MYILLKMELNNGAHGKNVPVLVTLYIATFPIINQNGRGSVKNNFHF